ncbi:MAG TPA: serine/threonine-protein kinase, partial [Polyangiaceae bacterium]
MTSVPQSEEAGPALIGTVVGGRYKIEALLGTGGMGAVFRAEHVHMRKAVAVKVLHREMTLFPEVVARFEREAVAAGRIEHPHVAAATDFGRLEDGSFYMVLEFVEGKSLSALLKSEGPLPETRALGIARQIADALSAAHGANIVHRDLKPENVMLVDRDGRADLVKVLDFGIAKVQLGSTGEQALTQLGSVFGTPEYMAPEQAQGLPVDARADLYTVGLILYEMLSGVSPFRHDEIVVVLTRQITAEPEPLPETITVETRELVYTLLKKDAKERVQTAAELRERLERRLAALAGTASDAVPAAAASATGSEGAEPSPQPTELPNQQMAEAHTALALPRRRTSFAPFLGVVRRVGLDRPAAIAGYAVPLGVLVAMAGIVLLIGA